MADVALIEPKVKIQDTVARIAKGKFADSARQLFALLGYSSDRRIDIVPNTAQGFIDQFGALNPDKALTSEWHSVEFLFQLTDEEIGNRLAFSKENVDTSVIESYIFLGIQLTGKQYSRTRLATIAREINKLFPMPVMVLFRYGDAISLAVIDRESNKRDSTKDLLRKVTLIKDIRLDNPARAHIDILYELSLPVLYNEYQFRNFVELHRAWAKKLDSSDLNKRFYQDISYWYLWAKNHPGVKLPRDVDGSSDEQRSISLFAFSHDLSSAGFSRRRILSRDASFSGIRLPDFSRKRAHLQERITRPFFKICSLPRLIERSTNAAFVRKRPPVDSTRIAV